ncbi:oxidoreductase [Armillaria solidipes]|uniref:Oxidoreductase n=1 Tax=Armillaria solidipes TaxID=1076256 RepID=A0A2H3BB54_9AGAR|nr:oxidoreductase [Armillaria solidipes]
MSLTLPGGIALITGSVSGIGQAVTIAYAKAGVEGILACDINFDGLDATIEECKKVASHPNFRVLPLKVDVRIDRDVINMVETAVKEFGRLDYAANVAGIVVTPVATVDQTIEDWDNIHAINVRGVFLCMREEIKAMLKNELRPLIPDRGGGMTKAAAVSHSGDGIRINTVNPGYTLTPQARAFVADFTPYENGTLLKRMGSPEEMADATLFLSSPLSSYMTGSSVYSDGGAMILLK